MFKERMAFKMSFESSIELIIIYIFKDIKQRELQEVRLTNVSGRLR